MEESISNKTDLLTVEELAQRLRVPVSWVYSRTRETGPGSMPRMKIGKYVRFIEREVMEWARRRSEREGKV
jgi:excisionase family DNA binding protein